LAQSPSKRHALSHSQIASEIESLGMKKSFSSRISAARRRADAILDQSRNRQESYKLEQRLASDARAEKTARLRELRLAKEAADREAAAENQSVQAAPRARKSRRAKQT
jgi:hypothetical protein